MVSSAGKCPEKPTFRQKRVARHRRNYAPVAIRRRAGSVRIEPSCGSIPHLMDAMDAMDAANRTRLLASREFGRLITRRWRVSLVLTACLFILYYGYILLIALNKTLVSKPLIGSVPVGIPLGAAVIVGAWLLTAAYVVWANRHYDPEVRRLRESGTRVE